jgi:hypothetical protein
MRGETGILLGVTLLCCGFVLAANDFPKPYSPPCVERENVFEFTEKPVVKFLGDDKYEISFAVKGRCDATVGIVDEKGVVVRHLASGVLGANAPEPLQKNSLKQTIYWDGKDDLDAYVRTPEKLRVRVMLGLKPVFDKLLGGSNPKNLPGYVLGIATDETGAYVWIRGQGTMGHVTIRKFNLDGSYAAALTPPPANLPEEKLAGRSYVEYEAGKRSHHGPLIMEDLGYAGNLLPGVGGRGIVDFQPVIADGRMYFCNAGPGYRSGKEPSKLYYLRTDGSSEVRGFKERLFLPGNLGHGFPRFAVSPDKHTLYFCGAGSGGEQALPAIFRCATDGEEPAEPFLGKKTASGRNVSFAVGSDNDSFNNPVGIACDAQGRIYVADNFNNRIQIFSPAGKYLKTLPADRPRLICVNPKTGAFYVQHKGTDKGRTVARLTKFTSFEKPTPEFHADGIETAVMALDSWSPRPRLWIGGGLSKLAATTSSSYYDRGPGVTVWEERDGNLVKISDFDEDAKKEGGADHFGRWEGSCYDKVVCDPVRETLWWCWEKNQSSRIAFDLATGAIRGQYLLYGPTDDIAFCKRGYLHCHFNPGFYMPGVGRLDPDSGQRYAGMGKQRLPRERVFTLTEAPYDYGVETARDTERNWRGILPVKDQPGAKFFQDGFGVNLRGDVAEQCNIYFVPKMEEGGWALADAGRAVRNELGQGSGPERYSEFMRAIEEAEKRGEAAYSIKREPGIPLAGGTIWTFDAYGELRDECAVIASSLVIGSMMDEDGCLYFANDRGKLIDGRPFLSQRGGNLGTTEPLTKYNRTPVTYTYLKTKPRNVRWLLQNAAVPLDPKPNRPAQLVAYGPFGPPYVGKDEVWVEGAEWLYAGYSPAVPAGCTCPSTRAHLDWFKRSYVPESYRRSIGILDTNGNLIMQLGRYGNYDDVLKMKPGDADVALTLPRFISGTDNYLAFDDWGESLKVLKLEYHAEETVLIRTK